MKPLYAHMYAWHTSTDASENLDSEVYLIYLIYNIAKNKHIRIVLELLKTNRLYITNNLNSYLVCIQ